MDQTQWTMIVVKLYADIVQLKSDLSVETVHVIYDGITRMSISGTRQRDKNVSPSLHSVQAASHCRFRPK